MPLYKAYRFSLLSVLILLFSCGASKQNFDSTKITYKDYRAKQKTFLSTHGAIKYIDEGQGKVILLLHGVPTSSWLYRKMIDGLMAKGFRVISPVVLGFGSSDSPDYKKPEHTYLYNLG